MSFGEAVILALFCFFTAIVTLGIFALVVRGMSYLLTNEKIRQKLAELSQSLKAWRNSGNADDKSLGNEQNLQTQLQNQDDDNAYGGTLRLFDVSDDEAALAIAIVCDELKSKPSELIFKSIKLIKE